MNENNVQKRIWLGLASVSTLFRLNTGKGWISNLGPKGVIWQDDGSIRMLAPRPVALGFGLVNGDPVVGACDLPGWTTVTITADMVGREVAVFTSIEVKKSEGGRTTKEQANWRDRVRQAGGIAGVAASPEEAKAVVDEWRDRLI